MIVQFINDFGFNIELEQQHSGQKGFSFDRFFQDIKHRPLVLFIYT